MNLGNNTRYKSIKENVQSFAESVLHDTDPKQASFSFSNFARPGCRPFVFTQIDQGEDLGYTILSISPRDHGLRRLKPVRRTVRFVLQKMGLKEKTTT